MSLALSEKELRKESMEKKLDSFCWLEMNKIKTGFLF